MVIVDRFTKSTHLEHIEIDQLVQIYIREIVRFHGVHINIVSDRDAKFTSAFWELFRKRLGQKST